MKKLFVNCKCKRDFIYGNDVCKYCIQERRGDKMNAQQKVRAEEKQKAKDYLIELFKVDLKKKTIPTIYTVCKHVSNNGMMRHIDVIYIKKDRTPQSLNWYIEKLGLYNRAKNYKANNADSLRVSGCGMDMGFDVVYTLGQCLTKELTKFKIVRGRNGDKKAETSGGYLLNQRWL